MWKFCSHYLTPRNSAIHCCTEIYFSHWIVLHDSTNTGGGSVANWLACWTQAQKAWVQIAAATLSGNSLRQTVHTHPVCVHQAAKLVIALLRIARVTMGVVEINGSLPSGLWLTSHAGWLPRTRISFRTLRTAIEYGLLFYRHWVIGYFTLHYMHVWWCWLLTDLRGWHRSISAGESAENHQPRRWNKVNASVLSDGKLTYLDLVPSAPSGTLGSKSPPLDTISVNRLCIC